MPVIFSTPTSHRIFMFDKDAILMLQAMQISGKIPGALFPEALEDALKALKKTIELANEKEDFDPNDLKNNDSNYVTANTKALPLIELIQRAIEKNEKLIWNKG